MPKKKDPEVIVEVEVEEKEIELSQEVINQFGKEIQTAINIVVDDNIDKDIRIELVNVLMSIASQISIDVGIDADEFLGMADFFYEQGENLAESEELDISTLN